MAVMVRRLDVTGQVQLDSYEDAGVLVAIELVNALTSRHFGAAAATGEGLPAIAAALAMDPSSVAALGARDVPGFVRLARDLRAVFHALDGGDVDDAAERLNELLARHPAHPHLAKEDGRWRLHHHPREVAVLPMWTAICAEALARMVGGGHAHRLGTCAASPCDRVYFDVSRNASRRFCSTTCQNRVKAAAFRQRQGSLR
jgi:predicted RNA-binding Zn ribbon-like protein